MKSFIVLLCVISFTYCKTLGHPGDQRESLNHHQQLDDEHRNDYVHHLCINMWDEGCINQQINGAGNDDYYLNGGGFNPGKRCINMWDDGCINNQLGGSGNDDYYLNGGGFNPGKRSLHDIVMKLQKNRPYQKYY